MENKIRRIIAEEIGNLYPEAVKDEERLMVELGASYADLSNIIVRIEQDYGIDIFSKISGEDIDLTVGRLIEIAKKEVE